MESAEYKSTVGIVADAMFLALVSSYLVSEEISRIGKSILCVLQPTGLK